jgi:hypothetical protein
MTDALYEGFKNEPAPVGIDPADGLPRPVLSQAWQDAQAPALDPDRFVCMGDFSTFVIRTSWGDPIATFAPGEVERAPDGRWRVSLATVVTKLRDQIDAAWAEQKKRKDWQLLGPVEQSDELCAARYVQRVAGQASVSQGYVAVEPLRPQCKHYARQLVPFPEERDRTLAIRLCTARRTDEGEFLDLGNQQVLACELRSPKYGNGASQIDAFDERTVAAQREAVQLEVADDFDLDAALAGGPTTKGN